MSVVYQVQFVDKVLESVNADLDTEIFDIMECLDAAVSCQISINRLVWKLNKMMEEEQ